MGMANSTVAGQSGNSQNTLAGRIDLSGVGVHSGKPVSIALLPADPDTGIASEIGTQERFNSVTLHGAVSPTDQVRIVATVNNLLDHRPDGWQAVIGRRVRIGVEAAGLFRR